LDKKATKILLGSTWQGDDGYSADAAISLFGSYLPQKL
jgi:hypothetical protein